MIILHTSMAGDRNTPVESGTWGWFRKYGPELQAKGWQIHHAELHRGMDHLYDYDALIKEWWGRDDLLVWERDNVPASFQQVLDLATCPELSCSIDYARIACDLVEVTAGEPLVEGLSFKKAAICRKHQAAYSMMRNVRDPNHPELGVIWNPGGWDHCTVPPLGLTRFRLELQRKTPPNWPQTRWQVLDCAIGETLARAGQPTHIHGPWARHHHAFPPGACSVGNTPINGLPILALRRVKPKFHQRILEATVIKYA